MSLGENLNARGLAAAAAHLGGYLYGNAVTRAAAFFDRCRALNPEASALASADPKVRTFGLRELGFAPEDVAPATVRALCNTLIARWRGGERRQPETRRGSVADPAALLAGKLATSLDDDRLEDDVLAQAKAVALDFAALVARLRDTVAAEIGADPDSYLSAALAKIAAEIAAETDEAVRSASSAAPFVLSALDALIQSPGPQPAAHAANLSERLQTQAAAIAEGQHASLRQWILDVAGTVRTPRNGAAGGLPPYRASADRRAASGRGQQGDHA